jgi:hypothetical protein
VVNRPKKKPSLDEGLEIQDIVVGRWLPRGGEQADDGEEDVQGIQRCAVA